MTSNKIIEKSQVREYFNGTGFDRWNKIYSKSDEINTVQKNIRKGHQKTVDDVVSYIKNYPELTKKSYCDAGCGVGSLSIPLLRLGIKELQVSDISSEMIKETKKRINELGLNQGKIKYEVCDLEKLKGLFDVVVCLDVFIHYPLPVAEEMVQHLCDLSKEKLIVSFAPYTPVLAVLKNIGKFRTAGYFLELARIIEKRKLLDKQKKGKQRLRTYGKVDIPQEAFIAALKVE